MATLTAKDLLIIHETVIQETGGSAGLRDPGMLESIAAKPEASFGGEELYPDIYSQAAALFEAVANYHVFVDANKRTAISALGLFLNRNGFDVMATNLELEQFTLKVAAGHPDLAKVAQWIRHHSQPISTSN